MDARQAIISFSQSEKVKSGLIWGSQCVHLIQNMPEQDKKGAVSVLQAFVAMMANEAQLARQASGDPVWQAVDKCLNNARIMIDSGVVDEAEYHFTQGLTQVNRIGQQSMSYLLEEGLLK